MGITVEFKDALLYTVAHQAETPVIAGRITDLCDARDYARMLSIKHPTRVYVVNHTDGGNIMAMFMRGVQI